MTSRNKDTYVTSYYTETDKGNVITTNSMNETTFGIIPVRKHEGKNIFLLVRSQQGNWGFPKGHPEKNEAPMFTARRELEEETGITDLVLFPQTFSEARVMVEADFTATKVVIWFLGMINGSPEVNIKDTNEISEYKWLRFDDAYELLTHDETKRVMLDVRLYLAKYETSDTTAEEQFFAPVQQKPA